MRNLILKASSAFLLSSVVMLTPLTASADTASVDTSQMTIDKVELTAEEQVRANKLADGMITMQAISIAVGDEKRARIMEATETNRNVSIEITNKELKEINKMLGNEGVNLLPQSARSLDITESSYVISTASGDNVQIFSSRSAAGTAWQITKCAGYIAVAIVPASKAYKAVKALGGIRQTASLLVGAGNVRDFLKIAGGVGAEIVGVDGIVTNCTF